MSKADIERWENEGGAIHPTATCPVCGERLLQCPCDKEAFCWGCDWCSQEDECPCWRE